jgi:hypothetical protein
LSSVRLSAAFIMLKFISQRKNLVARATRRPRFLEARTLAFSLFSATISVLCLFYYSFPTE